MGGREGVLDLFSVSIVVAFGFLLLYSPMEPATGWGVHGGLCVDMLSSVRVKKKREGYHTR